MGDATLDHHATGADVHTDGRFAVRHPGRFVEQIDIFLQREQGEGQSGRRADDDEQHHGEPPLAKLSHCSPPRRLLRRRIVARSDTSGHTPSPTRAAKLKA